MPITSPTVVVFAGDHGVGDAGQRHQLGLAGHVDVHGLARHAAQPLRVVLTATLAQVVRHLPYPFGHALHDAGPAQGFQPSDVGRDDFLRVAAGLGSALLDRQVMIGAVQAIARQRGDVLVGRPHLVGTAYLHHGSGGIVRQLVAGVQSDVVGLAVHAVDDQIAAVVQLVGQPLGGHGAAQALGQGAVVAEH